MYYFFVLPPTHSSPIQILYRYWLQYCTHDAIMLIYHSYLLLFVFINIFTKIYSPEKRDLILMEIVTGTTHPSNYQPDFLTMFSIFILSIFSRGSCQFRALTPTWSLTPVSCVLYNHYMPHQCISLPSSHQAEIYRFRVSTNNMNLVEIYCFIS